MHVICSGQMLRLVHCVLSFVYCPLSMVHSPLSTMYCLLSTVYGLSTVCSTIQGIATFQSSVLLHCNKQRCACSCTVPRNHTKEEGVYLQGQGRLVMPFLLRQWGWAACRWGGSCSQPPPRSLQSQTGCVRSCSREACTVMLLEVGAPFHAMQYSARYPYHCRSHG
jgi:hypothetical protein